MRQLPTIFSALAAIALLAGCRCEATLVTKGASARTPTDGVTAPTAATNADDAPQAAPSEEPAVPSAKTDVRDAAVGLAGRAVANALLLRAWQPDRIRRLDPADTEQDDDGCDYDGTLVEYDDQADALVIQAKVCWDKDEAHDENMRHQAAFLAMTQARMLVAAKERRPANEGDDEGKVALEICQTHVLPGVAPACVAEYGPSHAGSPRRTGGAETLTRAELIIVDTAVSTANACAEAIVSANAKTITDLAAVLEGQLRKEAEAAWMRRHTPEPQAIEVSVAPALTALRRTRVLRMPPPEAMNDLPDYCAAPRNER